MWSAILRTSLIEMALHLALIILTLARQGAPQASKDVPYCLQACLNRADTEICGPNTLATLSDCISETCPNPPATQNLIASLDVAYTPKSEYSCEQSVVPGASEDSVTLPLNGSCSTSPYGFRSFLPHAVSRLSSSSGCRVMVFNDEDCMGAADTPDIDRMDSGQCVFTGGRSARLTCQNEQAAARAYIQQTCGEDSSEDDATSASSTSSIAESAGQPYGSVGSSTATSGSVPSDSSVSTDTSSSDSSSKSIASSTVGPSGGTESSGTVNDELTSATYSSSAIAEAGDATTSSYANATLTTPPLSPILGTGNTTLPQMTWAPGYSSLHNVTASVSATPSVTGPYVTYSAAANALMDTNPTFFALAMLALF